MKRIIFIVSLLTFILALCNTSNASDRDIDIEVAPVKNNGKKWRVGYFEGDDYFEYKELLIGLIDALKSIKWIESVDNIPKQSSSREIWSYISKNVKSDYLEFVNDAFWSSDNEEKSCEKNKESIYKKTEIDKDIDIMFAMGTVAGKCLSSKIDNYHTNTMVMAASNPFVSQIIDPNDPKKKYIHATIEKDEFFNEISLFYNLVHFKNLGIVYKNTEDEKVYAAVDDAKRAGEKYKFEVFDGKVTMSIDISEKQRREMLIEKYKEISKKVDAIYITEHIDEKENVDFLKKLLEPIFEKKIATWSQTPRTWMVKYGVLMSLEGASIKDTSMFEATAMAKILRGKNPNEVDNFFVNPKKESIILNMETAQAIQLDLSVDVFASACKIYYEICTTIDNAKIFDNIIDR